MKHLLLVLAILASAPPWQGRLAAQTSSRPIISNKFHPSVITRMQEITARIPLTTDQYNTVAGFLTSQDSVIANAVLEGKTDQEVQQLRNKLLLQFNQLLPEKELKMYFAGQASAYTQKEAKLYSALLKGKYGLDKDVAEAIERIFYNERTQLMATYFHHQANPELPFEMVALVKKFDSVKSNLLNAAAAQHYLNEQLSFLNTVKPLKPHETQRLKNGFITLCMKQGSKGYADIFTELLRHVIIDTVYYAAIYKDEVNRQEQVNGNHSVNKIVKDAQVTPVYIDTIRSLVYKKERALAIVQYAFPVFNRTHDSLQNTYTQHFDSLINVVLIKDGTFPSVTSLSTAVKRRLQLYLSEAQVDSLIVKALELEEMKKDFQAKNPLTKFDGSSFEAQHLRTILTEEQHLKLLTMKYQPIAEKWAIGDWGDLQELGVRDGLDSAVTVRQITQYTVNRLVTKERYANDEQKQKLHMQAIEAAMPVALRRIRAARKLQAKQNTSTQSVSTNAFKW